MKFTPRFLCGMIVIFLFWSFAAAEDISLQDLIELAQRHNPYLTAAAREAEALEAAYEASKKWTNPELEYERGKAESYNGSTLRTTEGFSLTQPLENPWKRRFRIRAQKARWEAARAAYSFKLREIISEVKNLFHRIILLNKQKELAQNNEQAVEEIHDLIRTRVRLGEAKELEAIKLKVELLQARNRLQMLESESRLARERLNTVLGNSIPPDSTIQGRLDYNTVRLESTELIRVMEEHHPLIRQKEQELETSRATAGAVRWQRFPDLRLKGFSRKELDGRIQGIAISIDIPLWNFNSWEIAEAALLIRRNNAELSALKLNLTLGVKEALNRLELAEQNLALYNEGLLRQAEESLNISNLSYKQGEISLIDYLDSLRTHTGIVNEYYLLLYDWNAAKSDLEKAVGDEIP